MRAILLMAALAACGGEGSGPHDVVACGQFTGGPDAKCERGCVETPRAGIDDPSLMCRVPIGNGGALEQCFSNRIARYEGELGCCSAGEVVGMPGVTVFLECEAQ